jgi:LacI family transcriptional regulator
MLIESPQQPASDSPSLNLLKEIVLDGDRDMPLHAQLRASLRRVIEDSFKDEQRFYSENQLAAHFRISPGTVQRVLGDLVTEGLLKRKRARATYVQKKSSQFPRKLAVFLPDCTSPHLSKLLIGLNSQYIDRDIEVLFFYTHKNDNLGVAYKHLRFSPNEGAVILLGTSQNATLELEEALVERNYLFATVDTLSPIQRGHYVGPDNKLGIEMAMEYLISLGHQKITFLITEPTEHASIRERTAAFKQYCTKFHVASPAIHDCKANYWENVYTSAKNAMPAVWNTANRPTAILAASDMGALGAMKWLLEQGVSIPSEVSIMGFDGIDLGNFFHPRLTSVAQPYYEIATEVLRLLTTPGISSHQRVTLPPKLIIRDSTAAPRSN